MKIETLERLCENNEKTKVHVISSFGRIDLFTGYAYNFRKDKDSAMVDLNPYTWYYVNQDRLIKYKDKKYSGLRIYEDTPITSSIKTHQRELIRFKKTLALRESREFKKYLTRANKI